jgi:hypothetical protein
VVHDSPPSIEEEEESASETLALKRGLESMRLDRGMGTEGSGERRTAAASTWGAVRRGERGGEPIGEKHGCKGAGGSIRSS